MEINQRVAFLTPGGATDCGRLGTIVRDGSDLAVRWDAPPGALSPIEEAVEIPFAYRMECAEQIVRMMHDCGFDYVAEAWTGHPGRVSLHMSPGNEVKTLIANSVTTTELAVDGAHTWEVTRAPVGEIVVTQMAYGSYREVQRKISLDHTLEPLALPKGLEDAVAAVGVVEGGYEESYARLGEVATHAGCSFEEAREALNRFYGYSAKATPADRYPEVPF